MIRSCDAIESYLETNIQVSASYICGRTVVRGSRIGCYGIMVRYGRHEVASCPGAHMLDLRTRFRTAVLSGRYLLAISNGRRGLKITSRRVGHAAGTGGSQ